MEPRLVGAPSSNCERWLEERFQPKSYATVSGAREGGISSILDVRVRKAGEFGDMKPRPMGIQLLQVTGMVKNAWHLPDLTLLKT